MTKLHSQYKNNVILGRCTVNMTKQSIGDITSHCSIQLHFAQYHSIQMFTDDTDDADGYRWSQMNTGMTDITSMDTYDQEHPPKHP